MEGRGTIAVGDQRLERGAQHRRLPGQIGKRQQGVEGDP